MATDKIDLPKYPRYEHKALTTSDPKENESGVALKADDFYGNNSPSTRQQRSQALKKYDFESDNDDAELQPKASKRLKNSIRNQPPIKRKGVGPLAGTSRQKKRDFINDDDLEVEVDDDDDDDEGWINSKPQNDTPKRVSVGSEFNIDQIPNTEYSRRRITPPNPSKPKSTRGRKPSSAGGKSNQNQLSILKVNNRVRETMNKDVEMDISESPERQSGRKLTDEQIRNELMGGNISDDDDLNKKDETNDQELAEVRSSLLGENRLDLSITRLKKNQEMKKTVEEDAKVAEELNRQMEAEEKQKRVTAKILKADADSRAQEEAERLKNEKEERYRKIVPKPRASLHERNELRGDGDTIRPVDGFAWDPRADAQPLSVSYSTNNLSLQKLINLFLTK